MTVLVKPPKRGPKPRTRIASGGYIRRRTTIAAKRAAVKAAGYVDPDTWQAIVDWYLGRCAYCLEHPWAEQDHVIPIAKGGVHSVKNMVPSCSLCNAKKGTSTKWKPRRIHPWMEQGNEL